MRKSNNSVNLVLVLLILLVFQLICWWKEEAHDFKIILQELHFFNPVRYLPWLEIIPTKDTTDAEIVKFYMEYGAKFLGKTTVWQRYSMVHPNELGFLWWICLQCKIYWSKCTEVDKCWSEVFGRVKSTTFQKLWHW